MKSFVCFAAVLAVASAGCLEYPAQNPFSLANFTGTWYRQYSNAPSGEEGTCITSIYTMDEITGELNTNSSIKYFDGETEEQTGALGMAEYNSTVGDLTLRVASPWGEISQNISVLATDYDNYAVVYACVERDYTTSIQESFFVMTHEQTLTEEVRDLIQESVTTISQGGGPSFYSLYPSIQSNCS